MEEEEQCELEEDDGCAPLKEKKKRGRKSKKELEELTMQLAATIPHSKNKKSFKTTYQSKKNANKKN